MIIRVLYLILIYLGDADGYEDEADEEGSNIQVFNDEDFEIIKKHLKYDNNKDNTFNIAIYLDFLTGLRLGELLGMKKKFVEKNLVKVRNTLKRVKIYTSDTSWYRELKLIKPKSKPSIRTVYYSTLFWSTLQLYFKEQEKKWSKNGLTFNDDSLIFTTRSCQPIDKNNFYRSWKKFLRDIKVQYKKVHSIRDFYATTLIRRGASIHTVKEMLGHSSIKITEKYYIFVFPEDKSETANLLNDIAL